MHQPHSRPYSIHHSIHQKTLFLVATGVLAATPMAVTAQPADSQMQLQEIVVTARKREESLQRVPVAVSVIDQSMLDNNVTDSLTKIGELAPQVSLSQGGSGTGAVITVRGVSSASNDAGLDQSVAVELDNVPISRGQIISASMYDLQQVQILQGPQALFFGKNSPAGVISLKSADPTDTFEGYATAGYEIEAEERILEGAISGPLTDTLKARLAFRGSSMDGWLKNVAQPTTDVVNPAVTVPGAVHGRELPNEDLFGARLTLLWTPTEDFEANLKVAINDQERNAGNASSEPFCIGGKTQPVIRGTVPIPGGDCAKNRQTAHGAVAPVYAVNIPNSNNGVPYFDSDFQFGSLTLTKRLDDYTLTSTTGYYDQTVQQMSVSDWSPYASIWAASREEYDLFTQELRLSSEFDGPLNFMVGAYYESFDREFFNSADLGHVFDAGSQSYAAVMMSANNDGDYWSMFGQINWEFIENFELAVGARYSDDQKDTTIVDVVENPAFGGILYDEGVPLSSSFDDEDLSPEVTLSWYPSEDQTFYVAYKTGYKAGGISNPFLPSPTSTPANIQFKPEEAKGFEAGWKATLLDRRLRLDLVAYTYNYQDLQVVSYNSQTISFTINNAASADIEGVQGSFEWLALEDLTLRGNFGINSAEYDSYPIAQCYPGQTAATGCVGGVQNLADQPLLRAPDLTWSLGFDYSPDLFAGWDTTLSFQASHSDAFETATDNAPAGHQENFWLLNAALRVGPADGRYDITLLARNLTDEYYMLNSNGWSGASRGATIVTDQQVGFFNRPREVILQGTVRF